MPASGDVLSLAASGQSPFIYFELTAQRSRILRLASDQVGRPEAIPEFVAEGQQPAISYDGHWLAFLRRNHKQDRDQDQDQDQDHDHDQSVVWLSRDSAPPQPAVGWQLLPDILEMTVTTEGDIIAAVGGAANPHLSRLRKTGEAESLGEIAGAVRYPAISPDSTMLAFARRESGSWHLFVRQLATGSERQLTASACNATSPAWQDSHTLLYATDCSHGLSAVAWIELHP